ncbi:MAG: hypothetical protein QHH06_10510 [Clostridiales bacterium]|jgi:co-chaperonin GroES (HSP10)|nr:hypothetical protein [Eubacteriales bacterium]MDH7566898.1 hypothetical protein [Clostridiales bacterium]
MQSKAYKVRGKNKDTGRYKTLSVQAISVEHCKQIAAERGLLEPYEITELLPNKPTERQLAYAKDLGIIIPSDATSEDVSALISRVVDSDNNDPRSDLVDFANGREMIFSKYIGKKALYNVIFNTLTGIDKIAFFVFCVYRWLADDRDGNIDKHKYKDKFYSIAETLASNDSFIKSMNKYAGEDIRFLGEIRKPNGSCYYGGSTNTIAYKIVSEIICNEFGLVNRKVKIMNPSNNFSSNTILKKSSVKKIGCLPVFIICSITLLLIFIIIK